SEALGEDADAARAHQEADDDQHDAEDRLALDQHHDPGDDQDHGRQPEQGHHGSALLLASPLLGLAGIGSSPLGLGLRLVLGSVALGRGLVLLGLTFPTKVLVAGRRTGDLLGLALHALDDAGNTRLAAAALIRPLAAHGPSSGELSVVFPTL